MKKITIFLIAIMSIMTIAFAQPPVQKLKNSTTQSSEIARIINMSKQANLEKNGILNPDKIYPGQTLTFKFSNGIVKDYAVEKGHSQWRLVSSVLKDASAYGSVVDYNDTSGEDSPRPGQQIQPQPVIPFWLVALIVGVFLTALLILFFKRFLNRRKDPVTSGLAIREGGVTDEQARAYASEVAARQFNVPNLQVTNVTRGRISGNNVAVFYAGQATPQRRTFSNIVGYRGIVTVKKNEQFVYFLQGCGNDVRVGNYFTGGDIQFIPETIIHDQIVDTATTSTTSREEVKIKTETVDTKNEIKSLEKELDFIKSVIDKVRDKDQTDIKITTPSGIAININFFKESKKDQS
jgi:hypothetical protein